MVVVNTPETDFRRWREKGQPNDLAAVFDATANELLRVGFHLRDSLLDAEDLVQQTFLEAMKSAGSWDERTPLAPWLTGILRRQASSLKRRTARGRELEELHAPDEQVADSGDLAERREAAEILLRAAKSLEEPYRAAMLLQLRHGLGPTEIADVLGRAPGTVRVQLHRAQGQLRERIPAGVLSAAPAVGLEPLRGLQSVRSEVLRVSPKFATAATGLGVTAIVALVCAVAFAAVVTLQLLQPERTTTPKRNLAQADGPSAPRELKQPQRPIDEREPAVPATVELESGIPFLFERADRFGTIKLSVYPRPMLSWSEYRSRRPSQVQLNSLGRPVRRLAASAYPFDQDAAAFYGGVAVPVIAVPDASAKPSFTVTLDDEGRALLPEGSEDDILVLEAEGFGRQTFAARGWLSNLEEGFEPTDSPIIVGTLLDSNGQEQVAMTPVESALVMEPLGSAKPGAEPFMAGIVSTFGDRGLGLSGFPQPVSAWTGRVELANGQAPGVSIELEIESESSGIEAAHRFRCDVDGRFSVVNAGGANGTVRSLNPDWEIVGGELNGKSDGHVLVLQSAVGPRFRIGAPGLPADAWIGALILDQSEETILCGEFPLSAGLFAPSQHFLSELSVGMASSEWSEFVNSNSVLWTESTRHSAHFWSPGFASHEMAGNLHETGVTTILMEPYETAVRGVVMHDGLPVEGAVVKLLPQAAAFPARSEVVKGYIQVSDEKPTPTFHESSQRRHVSDAAVIDAVLSDAAGRFVLHGPRAFLRLDIEYDELRAAFVVPVARRGERDYELERAFSLRVQVREGEDLLADGRAVCLYSGQVFVDALYLSENAVQFGGLLRGEYRLRVGSWAGGGASLSETVELGETQLVEHTLVFPSIDSSDNEPLDGDVTGRVVDFLTRRGVAGLKVRAIGHRGAGLLDETTTSAQGDFVLTGVPPDVGFALNLGDPVAGSQADGISSKLRYMAHDFREARSAEHVVLYPGEGFDPKGGGEVEIELLKGTPESDQRWFASVMPRWSTSTGSTRQASGGGRMCTGSIGVISLPAASGYELILFVGGKSFTSSVETPDGEHVWRADDGSTIRGRLTYR